MGNGLNSVAAVVLAGGKGTRIGQHLPKVLYPVVGRPMLHYTLRIIEEIPVPEIYMVVGFRAIDVKGSLRNKKIKFVYQKEQLGTAQAVSLAVKEVSPDTKDVIVFNGDDSAFFEPSTLRKFMESHKVFGAPVSLITVKMPNPRGLGRIIRNEENEITGIVEEKDATESEREIKEVNTGCFIFDKEWLTGALPAVEKNQSGEYYLTDLIGIAVKAGEKINAFLLNDAGEWLSVNTQEELEEADKKMLEKLIKQKSGVKTVFILDADNTLLDTEAIKKLISSKLVPELLNKFEPAKDPSMAVKVFWDEYDRTREELKYVSIPDFSENFAKRVGDESLAPAIKEMFYGLPFNDFLLEGAGDLVKLIGPQGEVIIFTDGDLAYQLMKVKNLSFSGEVDEIFVYEDKMGKIPDIIRIYKNARKFVFDDKVTVLEEFKRMDENAITVHLKQGSYKDLPPKDEKFRADFEAASTREALNLVKNNFTK